MYLSYLMGADKISDQDLIGLGIDIVGKTAHQIRKLNIPNEAVTEYRDLVKERLTPGFWNEFLNENGIHFIFKFASGDIQEYTLSPENEKKISLLCADFNDEPLDKNPNVYKHIADNRFYHDFMMEHYKNMVER